MDLKTEKGFTGVDISISIIIIIIFVSIITSILYNLDIQSKKVERKEQATSIIIDILEHAKGTQFDEISEESLKNYSEEKYSNLKGYTISISCKNETDVLNIEKNSDEDTHVGKKVTVNVKYLVGKEEQNLEIYTWILSN